MSSVDAGIRLHKAGSSDWSLGAEAPRRASERSGIPRRQASHQRIKDSRDLFKERELQQEQSQQEVAPDGASGGSSREGKARQFKVANVGNNGMIYLRPVQKSRQNIMSQTPPFKFPDAETYPVDEQRKGELEEQPGLAGLNPIGKYPTTLEKRSFSRSMLSRRLGEGKVEPGSLKIVIDRPSSVNGREEGPKAAYPSIEVPIPNYKLGTPRFSARGTAFLHQSTYTQSSTSGDHSEQEPPVLGGGDYDHLFPRQPGFEAHAVLSRRHSHASPQPYSIQTSLGQLSYVQSQEGSGSDDVSPQVFDDLSANPHDATIVKYSPINGDIIAATPARIIVQITSEKFLDYELLSDFFLTVRAYLSTHDLLSLLLARFEWAINRLDDNGRVIRVRTFAALRHWVLNYFSYDFVIDRELRVKFCDRINYLAKFVKGHSAYGPSDSKLIADLKKCWNGRCSLFWDSLPLEGHQDLDIQPGGIVGSRDSQLVHQSQLRVQPIAPQLGLNPAQLTTGATSIANWYSAVMEHSSRQAYGHVRNASTATSRSLPISPSSENSVPVLSCSIPAKGFKRGYPYTNKALGIHPIPSSAAGKRMYPPTTSSSTNENRRSGSFSDAARDRREPLSSEVPVNIEDYAQYTSVSDRSLLRGHSIPPGGPYVSAVASTAPGDSANHLIGSSNAAAIEQSPGRTAGNSNSPHVKSFIGNIRRALSSKHTSNKISSTHGQATSSPRQTMISSLGKSASIPLNAMFQATSSGQLESYRSVRVDLLAAEIYDSFRQAAGGRGTRLQHNVALESSNKQQHTQEQHREAGINDDVASDNNRLRPPELRRFNSAMTDSSQSILIVDDTGLNLPDMGSLELNTATAPGPNEFGKSSSENSNGRLVAVDSTKIMESNNEPALEEEVGEEVPLKQENTNTVYSERTSRVSEEPALARNSSASQTPVQSVSLRRYASFQSTFTKKTAGRSIEITKSSSTGTTNATHAPARMLRRRPGGDLRANQNVQDLEVIARPVSAGSITAYSESVRDSEALGFGERITRTFNARKSSKGLSHVPMDGPVSPLSPPPQKQSFHRPRSSQPRDKRRPSFEAAVAQFARIPDDDEGGIEATLLKLEGRYISPLQSPTPQNFPENVHSSRPAQRNPDTSPENMRQAENGIHGPQLDEHTSRRQGTDGEGGSVPRERLVSTLYAVSDDSYNSVPLLERGAKDEADEGRRTQWWGDQNEDRMSSGEIVQETSSLRRLRHGSLAPTATTDSFLLDENDEFLSETSSEISLDTIEAEQDHHVVANSGADFVESVNLGQQPPPSPPMTADNGVSYASAAEQITGQEKPPTPDPSPISHHAEPSTRVPKSETRGPSHPRHMPFILGCDSDVLAEQFTLVEQDALKEVDWRDLVDMRWQNTATSTTNWVDYLLTQDPLGIDLVTARFNIMVKWTLSEIVLTDNIEERALTIMRYIHIAQKARELNNYATLLQLTIALTSADCTRLSKTWNIVPDKEKETLQDLEMLVSPRRNFHNLRVEMEKANADAGCIPVVALYIHDLTYNAQKPALLPGSVDGEPLVNFERYRSSAVIVKNLLRLVDASTKYSFQPVEGIIERCLWMACLTDEMIAHTSKQQEYSSS